MQKVLKAKRADTGKWWTYGWIFVDKYGHDKVRFKLSDDFMKMIEDSKDYVYFSVFDDTGQYNKEKGEANEQVDDSLGDDPDCPY